MTWEGVTIMDQRVRFISEYLDRHFSVAEICRQFNISRKTGYKWLTRYEAYGALGLEERIQGIGVRSCFLHFKN